MRSRSSFHQLALLQSSTDVRERRAHTARRLAISRYEDLVRQLQEMESALIALEQERQALFAQHSGLMTRDALLQLKRRESILETRRINLVLDRVEIEAARAKAEAAVQHAREAAACAQRKREKLKHVQALYQQDFRLQEYIQEDSEIEERRNES